MTSKPTAEDRAKWPEIFVEDKLVDPRTRTRTVECKVLSMGMPRTGSVSLGKALEILGYGPIIHGFNACWQSRSNHMWEEGVEAKWPGSSKSAAVRAKVQSGEVTPFGRHEFDQLLGEYEVVTDMPGVAFAPELIAAYPEAKVIIVERNVDTWAPSFQIAWACYDRPMVTKMATWVDEQLRSVVELNQSISRGLFKANNRAELIEKEKEVYTQHYANIRKITPAERLLDFKLADGWAPLCAFLGKDVPDMPFPHLNDKAEYTKKASLMAWECIQRIKNRMLGTGEKPTPGVAA